MRILLQNQAGHKNYGLPEMPLDICGAYSQGFIGYMIEQQMRNTLEVNNISDNQMFGMQLLNQSNDNVVLANVFADDGLHITDSYNNTVQNNTVNTELLMYLEDESDVTVDYDTGQIITALTTQDGTAPSVAWSVDIISVTTN